MKVSRRPDHTSKLFLKRTIAAQIHLVTALGAIAGLMILAPMALESGRVHFWSSLAFGLTAILVFGTSATYHFMMDGYEGCPQLNKRMKKLDQWSIYLFIAGTYTPFLVNAIASPWKEVLLISIWTMAAMGIAYTALRHRLPRWAQSRLVYTSVFLLMGWTMVVRIGEIWTNVPTVPLLLLVGGALAYSVGAVVYITRKPRLFEGVFGFHELWHGFVTLGFVCHFSMILNFYL